jgi:hypothetical protein
MSLLQAFKRAMGMAPVVHPVDGSMAKRWVKQRLLAVYPELRADPKALEQAYQTLGLDAHPGGPGEPDVVFEINIHREPDRD